MEDKHENALEWLIPFAFILCAGWITWHLPAFILTCFPPEDASNYDKLSALFDRVDVTPHFYRLFGGFADVIDWGALILLPILGYFGMRTVRRASMEFENWTAADRLAVFVGRITMMLVILLCTVMLYEVFLRYVLEATKKSHSYSYFIPGITSKPSTCLRYLLYISHRNIYLLPLLWRLRRSVR